MNATTTTMIICLTAATLLLLVLWSHVFEQPIVLGSEDNGDGRIEYLCMFSTCDKGN